jgi:hypothetical protein
MVVMVVVVVVIGDTRHYQIRLADKSRAMKARQGRCYCTVTRLCFVLVLGTMTTNLKKGSNGVRRGIVHHHHHHHSSSSSCQECTNDRPPPQSSIIEPHILIVQEGESLKVSGACFEVLKSLNCKDK